LFIIEALGRVAEEAVAEAEPIVLEVAVTGDSTGHE
jgi:hypothetical protein